MGHYDIIASMITRNRILFVVGLWIVLVPFLGFPSSYKTFFTIISGVMVVFLAFLYARHKRLSEHESQYTSGAHEVYTESMPGRPQKPQKSIYAVYAKSSESPDKEDEDEEESQEEEEDKFTNIEAFRSRSRIVRTH